MLSTHEWFFLFNIYAAAYMTTIPKVGGVLLGFMAIAFCLLFFKSAMVSP